MRRFQKQIHPGVAALFIILAFIIVQGVWWRFLVYKEKASPPGGGGGGGGNAPPHVDLMGRTDVMVETFAGGRGPGDADGPGYAARFDRPTGLALDSQGNLYVADTGNHRIRKITPGGETTTLAGSEQGFADGPVAQARFNAPCGVTVAPDGAIYVADTGNGCVRRIQNGQVTTIAGKANGDRRPGANGSIPSSVFCMAGSNPLLMVADAGGKRVEQLRLDGTEQSAPGGGNMPGPPTAAVGTPQTGVAIPSSGTLILGAQTLVNVPVAGGEILPDVKARPALHHPVALWPLGDGWLVTDSDHGVVFLVRNGKAEVFAGFCSSVGHMRNFMDGNGEKARFDTLGGIVSDGKRYVYVSDTASNAIRRIDISSFIGN